MDKIKTDDLKDLLLRGQNFYFIIALGGWVSWEILNQEYNRRLRKWVELFNLNGVCRVAGIPTGIVFVLCI